jgi:hypothetical protein
MNDDRCYMHIYFYNKLSSFRSSNWTCSRYQVQLYKTWHRIRFHSIVYFSLSLTQRHGPDDFPVISTLLLTCKVREGDSFHYQIGLLPIGFVPHLLRRGNSIMFNLVFSFPSFFYISSRFLWLRYSYDVFYKISLSSQLIQERSVSVPYRPGTPMSKL